MSFHLHPKFRYRILPIVIATVILGGLFPYSNAEEIQFNMDVLDVEDKQNIDLGQFAQSGHIMPGSYLLDVKINQQSLGEERIVFEDDPNSPTGSKACLPASMIEKLGLLASAQEKLTLINDGQCIDPSNLTGVTITGDLSSSSLLVNVPQAYLEYQSPDWDPPSRWDNGLPAVLFDYNVNGSIITPKDDDRKTFSLTGNGEAGVNLGAWRFRGEWQGQAIQEKGKNSSSNTDFTWNRFYAYRALASIQAKLLVGENYFNSAIFDSFRFIGAAIETDLNMVPPNLRGYAPEIVGTAKTNATVTVRQQGRVVYESQVAQGPFRITDLSDALSGTLNVTVKEQDGTVQQFDVDTANLPFLTRPGDIQYKLALGQPTNYERHSEGENFASGEFSWGIRNGWSLFGGLLGSERYQAVSVGLGRDLLALGALSFDITQSVARLPDERLTGGSYRLSYSKKFEEYNSQITFAGYRFSERDFMTMNDFLNAKKVGYHYGSSKELYTLSFNKNFIDSGLSLYLSYNHQTYWNEPENNYYSLILSKYFDIGSFKNISASLTLNHQVNQGSNDDSAYLSLSMPWGAGSSISYSMDARRGGVSNRASYYDTLNDRMIYSMSLGENRKGASTSGFFTYQGDSAVITGNASYANNDYRGVGLNMTGGLTLTPEGGGIHRTSQVGGTRLILDTGGIADVPIKGIGAPVRSNRFGKAIVSDMNSYYRNNVQIDLNKLADNVDAEQSVVQATLTEGAVGYRKFNVLYGEKAMVIIRLSDGTYPPFGAQVKNTAGQNTGIVSDGGNTYLSGITPSGEMTIAWGNDEGCRLKFPSVLDFTGSVLLPCETQPPGSITKL
ncbi:outer membrane usher protein [Providencia sp. Me31A]|uniref:outer membrane usher protein n=1 Tax=Providencia sp. Me31A TaxID=3392637 RepID=UPI003D26A518